MTNKISGPLLSRKEAAAYLRVSPKTLAAWHYSGRLRGVKLGSGKTCRVVYPQCLLDEFAARWAAESNAGFAAGREEAERR